VADLNGVLLLLGFTCFALFSWGVRGHFRSTGTMPLGMQVVSGLSLAGFLWFVERLVFRPAGGGWPLAVILFAGGLALFGWAVRATAKTPPTLAFADDEPSFLLRHGPYRHVRHPFYLSYLMFWVATGLATRGLAGWLAPVVMLGLYWDAAAREERKFAGSDLAEAYAAYRAKAGMFLPRPSALRLG